MPSVLSDLRGPSQRLDTHSVLARIFAGGSVTEDCTDGGHSLNNDILKSIDGLISGIQNKSDDRVSVFRLLARITAAMDSYPALESRLFTLIERLPTLLESTASQAEDALGYNEMLEGLLDTSSDEIDSRISRIIPKLTACATRLCDKEANVSSGLQTITTLATSRFRNLLLPSASAIRRACIGAICHPVHNSAAARCLALLISADTPQNWEALFLSITVEWCRLVQLLGIKVGVDQNYLKGCAPWIASSGNIEKLHGCRRVLAVERALGGCCKALSEMLSCGCSSGPISVEVTFLLPLVSTIISLSVDLPARDPRSQIENESGVSPNDLKVVSSQLKTHALSVFERLLSTQGARLLPVSSALCRLLSNALAGHDMNENALVARSVLRCVRVAVRCFPSAVTREMRPALVLIFNMLAKEVSYLTAVRSSVLIVTAGGGNASGTSASTGATGKDNHGQHTNPITSMSYLPTATVAGAAAVLETCEMLLLFCGPMLLPNQRESLQIAVARGLACLCKGVVTPHFEDRRMRRTTCEMLRECPLLQLPFLRLAYADLFCSTRDGVLSGNAALLRRACENCATQETTSTECVRILLAIDALVTPSAVALPAVPASISAQKYLNQLESNAVSIADAAGMSDVAPHSTTEHSHVDSSSSASSSSSAMEASHVPPSDSKKRTSQQALAKNTVDDTHAQEKKQKQTFNPAEINITSFGANKDKNKNASAAPDAVAAKNTSNNKPGGAGSGKKDDNDDDDDDLSLPDIDVDADP